MNEQPVRRVMVACPTCGKPLFTGMGMDATSFERFSSEMLKVSCPDHGESYVPGSEAFLEEEEPSAQ